MNFFQQPFSLTAVRCLALLAVFICSARLPAAEPTPLDTLVAETVANNPELNFYEAEIAAAKGGRMAAGEWANPELSGEFGNKQDRKSVV